MVVQVSPLVSVPLSSLMVVFAAVPLALYLLDFTPPNFLDTSALPIFTAWRNERGEVFAAKRMEDAYIHFGLLHIVPAIAWSILMPLQYWDSLRKARPALHRFCGYVALSSALVLGISGVAFIPRRLSWSNPIWTMHRVYGTPVLPSFDAFLVLFASPSLLFTLFRALSLARQKRFAEHRRWAVLHGISGYLISIQRVMMVLFNIFGQLLAAAPALQRALGTDSIKSTVAISEAEKAAFSATLWAGGVLAALWALSVMRQAGMLAGSKSKAKVA